MHLSQACMVQGKHWLRLNLNTHFIKSFRISINNLQLHIKTFTLLYKSRAIQSYKADVVILPENLRSL